MMPPAGIAVQFVKQQDTAHVQPGPQGIQYKAGGRIGVPSRMITLILADWRFLWHARC